MLTHIWINKKKVAMSLDGLFFGISIHFCQPAELLATVHNKGKFCNWGKGTAKASTESCL